MTKFIPLLVFLALYGCKEDSNKTPDSALQEVLPKGDYTISADKTHDKFSSAIPFGMKVPDGSTIEVFMKEATGGQLNITSTIDDWNRLDFGKIHTLTGPIHVEGAEPGDVLSVEIIDLEPGEWGWTVMTPEFGFFGRRTHFQFAKNL